MREMIRMNATVEADPAKACKQDDATGVIRFNCRVPQGGIAVKVNAKKLS
jgi:hypothetical protein